jgi:hypothetical protein
MAVTFFATDPNVSRSIAAYNEGLSREAMARIQAAADTERAQIAAQAQQRALQQNAQQQQWINALRQQELQQQAKYQTGQLENDKARYAAQDNWTRTMEGLRLKDNEADRTSREKIAEITMGRYAPSATDISAENNLASSHAGRLNFALKNLLDSQAADEKKITAQYDADMAGFSPITTDKSWAEKRDKALEEVRGRYRLALNQLVTGIPKDAPVDFDQTKMQFVPRLITAPTTGPSTGVAAPAAGGVSGGGGEVAPRSFFGPPAPGTPEATALQQQQSSVPDPGSTPITVRRSDGSVVTIEAKNWAEAKRRDPGATQVAQGSNSITASTPPPAEVPPAPFQQNKMMMPAAAGLDMLRDILKGPNGNRIDIGKSPLTEMFGWGAGDIPRIAAVIEAAERGQAARDKYGNAFNLTPEQIKQAKEILSQITATQ